MQASARFWPSAQARRLRPRLRPGRRVATNTTRSRPLDQSALPHAANKTMTSIFGLPHSAWEWVLLLAIASSSLCLMALGAMIIVHKGLTMGADRAISMHSFFVALLIVLAALASWIAVAAPWVF